MTTFALQSGTQLPSTRRLGESRSAARRLAFGPTSTGPKQQQAASAQQVQQWLVGQGPVASGPAAAPIKGGPKAARAMACTASGNGTQPAGKQTVEVHIAELETLCVKALKTLGYKDEEIKILNEVCGSCMFLQD
jgi:hypothetical protein